MPEIKFYVATFSEAVSRCASIAPTKGIAFDKAHGILLEYDQDKDEVSIRSTDLMISYREVVNDVVSVDTEGRGSFKWRLPSNLLAGIVRNMPLDGELTMQHKPESPTHIHLKCGRKKAKLRYHATADDFPGWNFVEVDDRFVEANGLGERLKQVGWAVDKNHNLLRGIHMNGEWIYATDKYKLVKVPFVLDIDKPVTVSMSELSRMLANLPGKFTAHADETNLYLCIGKEIRISSQLLDGDYPDVGKIPDDGYLYSVEVPRESLSDIIGNQLVLVKNERYPRVQFDFGDDWMTVALVVDEVGDMEDMLDVKWEHPPLHIEFTPDYVIRALSGTDATRATLFFNSGTTMMMIRDDEDYVAWVQPRT